jgi:RNA polymerase sigma factor (sigma-70 family)
MIAEESTDSELVSRSLAGDREAFSGIVRRYQNLICALAYSRLGNLGQSEDLAQETFVTAWNGLNLLREPDKLRSWLCGIVRNRLHKHLRRETHEPVANAAWLESVPERAAGDALPCDEAIGREEEAILWRSLEKIPELYREPLILFYREQQSIEQVARELELTQDAVKQRLSRGRKLLQEEVQMFVESTLRRTAPDQTFSVAVLGALPSAPAATAGLGAVGKGAAAAKSGFLAVWLVLLAPFIGIFAGLASQLMVVRETSTGRERRGRSLQLLVICIGLPAMAVIGESAVESLSQHFGWSNRTYYVAKTVFWWTYAMGLATWLTLTLRKMQLMQESGAITGEISDRGPANLKPGTRIFAATGMSLMLFAWLLSVAYRMHDLVTAGIIAGTMIGYGIWSYFRPLSGNSGAEAVRSVTQQMALYGGFVLVVFNLRLDVWMASGRGVSVTEIHVLYPLWIMPLLTLVLITWIGVIWARTRPGRRV